MIKLCSLSAIEWTTYEVFMKDLCLKNWTVNCGEFLYHTLINFDGELR